MCLIALAGCVSTTTGSPKPVADDEDAAEYNHQLGARYYQNGKYELARDRLLLSIDRSRARHYAFDAGYDL